MLLTTLLSVSLNNCIQAKTPQALHSYLWGNFNSFQLNHKEAETWYKKAFAQDISPYAHQGRLHHLLQQKKFQEIVALIPQLDSVFKNHVDVQLIFAQAQLHTGDKAGYGKRIIALNKQFKTNKDVAFHAAQLYIERKELENALTVIDEFLNSNARTHISFIFHFLKAQLYTQLNNKKKALASAYKTVDSNRRFTKGWLLVGVLEEQHNNIKKALEAYVAVLRMTQANPQLEKHIMHLAFKGHIKQGQTTLTINKNCFNKAMMLFKAKQYEKGIQLLEECIKNGGTNLPKHLTLKIKVVSLLDSSTRAFKHIARSALHDSTQHGILPSITQYTMPLKTQHIS